MNKPQISVLIPIYNVEPYLVQCINSICNQTVHDLEILLIDDGSTDGSQALADELAGRDDRIKVIHKPNSGYGSSLNRGLADAQGEWISIIEPDDWADASMYERLLECAYTHENGTGRIDIVKGGYWRVIQNREQAIHEEPCIHLSLVNPEKQPFSIAEYPQLLALHPSIWSALYRKDFLDEFGIRFLPIPGAGWADNPFFIETMIAARNIVWLGEPVYYYREFEDGTLSHLKDWHIITDRWDEMNRVLRKYDAECPQILSAHACRGCAYLQMLSHDFDQNDPDLQIAQQAMANSIDSDIVKSSPYVPAEYKRAYARFLPFPRRLQLIL